MRLVQFLTPSGDHRAARVGDNGEALHVLRNVERVYELALEAGRTGRALAELVDERVGDETVDYEAIIAENRLLPPLDHPDPAHFILSGTGLDHLGSAQTRNAMHEKLTGDEELTDSMKMFPARPGRGQARAGRNRLAAGVVLQGRRLVARAAGAGAGAAQLCARRW